MIESLQDFQGNVAAFLCSGHVTQDDYEAVLIPAVEKKLKEHDKIRLYYETAADFAGIEPSAVWEDFKTGMEHFTRWERIAVVTDVEWIKHTMQAFSFVMPGELKVFPRAEITEARAWIESS